MRTARPDHTADGDRPDLEDVVGWLTRATTAEMSLVVDQLHSMLAEQLIGASVLGITETLRLAAERLRKAHVKHADKDIFEQFALEVDDVLARVAALMAVRQAP